MRPEDLTRALETPADRLDRAWAATRLAEPSTVALDALWAQASARIDSQPTPLRFHDDKVSRPTRRLPRYAVAGLVLVQAAAVLIAIGLRRDEVVAPKVAIVLNIEPDTHTMIRIGKDNAWVDERHDDSPLLGPQMAQFTPRDTFNQAEGMVTP